MSPVLLFLKCRAINLDKSLRESTWVKSLSYNSRNKYASCPTVSVVFIFFTVIDFGLGVDSLWLEIGNVNDGSMYFFNRYYAVEIKSCVTIKPSLK